MISGTLVIWSLSRSDNGIHSHVRMGSSGVRAPIWTASGMRHWKILIISGGTAWYYCINQMTRSIHVYYGLFMLAKLLLSYLSSCHIYTLHFLYSSQACYSCTYILCISCIPHSMCFIHINTVIPCTSCIHIHIIHDNIISLLQEFKS